MKSSKGSEFERKISKELSLWWTDGLRDDIFWRSQTSGARATQRKKIGKTTANQDGDLTAMDPIGQPLIDLLSIELKCGYPEFTLEGIINRPRLQKPLLKQFLEQCDRELTNTKRYFWLVVRQHLKGEIIIFDKKFRHWLLQNGIERWMTLNRMELRFDGRHILVLRLGEFLSCLRQDNFRHFVEGKTK